MKNQQLSCLLLFSTGLFLANRTAAQPVIRLEPGLVITESVRLEPGRYRIPADSNGAIIIRGADIVVDFQGALLDGATSEQTPDQFSGTGIRIDTGSNITLMNAVVRGFKVGLFAVNAPGLHVSGSDFSYNYRQRLKSTLEREHLDDWMSYHHNESDEWLRYGAAIYIRGSDGVTVDHVTITGGQNGLMLTGVNDARIYDNDITFNSGIGVGLYRSSRNHIQHNRLDWNVRGYSHGVYNRGQDSAAILVYEQSNENVFAYNSATHSGDGFFLWAGQTTMDTGEGGCNDNLIYDNDFSYAPTNGIEITFSRNQVVRNRIKGCWHGIWGGYSFDTRILQNTFIDNTEHIAIEHGQDIVIEANDFTGGEQGIRLWERASQPSDWGYVQNRDVQSRNFRIVANDFDGVGTPLNISNTDTVSVTGNLFRTSFGANVIENSESVRLSDNYFSGFNGAMPAHETGTTFEPPLPLTGQSIAPLTVPDSLTRKYILVDEWGPYDFRSPVIWPRSSRTALEQQFEILGPPGRWRIAETPGVDSVSVYSGAVPGSVRIWRSTADIVDLKLNLFYTGQDVTDRFGNEIPAGDSVAFDYSFFFAPIAWSVSFYNYDESNDPRTHPDAFRVLLGSEPVARANPPGLALQWYRSPASGVGADHFATVSTGTFTVPSGTYTLNIPSDDGVRVWLDGALVYDDWTYHPPRDASIDLELGGQHRLRIEHYEIDGYATISASITRKSTEQ